MLKLRYYAASVLALGLLIPGLFFDLITLQLFADVKAGHLVNFNADVLNQSRSILGTVQDLFAHGLWIPATLILVFSVLFPSVKLLVGLLVALEFRLPWLTPEQVYEFLRTAGKWSMADVFVVAVFIAYLSSAVTDRHQQTFALFGMRLDLDVQTQLSAHLGSGFYYFTASCLVAHFSTRWLATLIAQRS